LDDFSYRVRRFLSEGFNPVTKTIAIISGSVFLLSAIIPSLGVLAEGMLSLYPGSGFFRFWTMVTYPFYNGLAGQFWSLIFGILWLWMIGSSLERSWGSKTYGLFLFLTTLVTGASLSLTGFFQFGPVSNIYGLWLPLTGLTWAWAEISPDQEVSIWGIIPVKARWLAWISAAFAFFTFFPRGTSFLGKILCGLASISGIAVTYLFTGKGPLSRGYRYWAWQRKAAPNRWNEQPKRKPGRRRLRVIK
jgi:membrane associated rhomboid family serine protease